MTKQFPSVFPQTQGDNTVVGEQFVEKHGILVVGFLNFCPAESVAAGKKLYHPTIEFWDVRDPHRPFFIHSMLDYDNLHQEAEAATTSVKQMIDDNVLLGNSAELGVWHGALMLGSAAHNLTRSLNIGGLNSMLGGLDDIINESGEGNDLPPSFKKFIDEELNDDK